MARVKYSAMVADVRGSIGGAVFARNRGGAYVRNKTQPINPSSPLQQSIRAILSSLNSAWLLLTVVQRSAWALYAQNVPSKNVFGETVYLTGQNWYVNGNSARLNAGLSRVDAAPTLFERSDPALIQSLTFDLTVGLTMEYDDTEAWCDETGSALLIYTSAAKSVGVNFFKGPYRYAGQVLGDDVAPPSSPVLIAVADIPQPPTAVGQKIFVRAMIVRADGRTSVQTLSDVIVT